MESRRRVWRLLDANLNRAREGMRVAEELLKFIYRRPDLYRKLRNLRHGLDRTAVSSYGEMLSARDSRSDAGRYLKECGRGLAGDLLIANMRRSQEGVRVLEECGKLFPGKAGFKEIRFKLYDIEKEIYSSLKRKIRF